MAALWIPKRLTEAGLINVATQNRADFIAYCEQDYEGRVADAAKAVAQSKAKVVMLSGPSASGKTTTACKLAACLCEADIPAAVVSLDDFYRNIEDYPELPGGGKDYESIQSLDVQAIHSCLGELIETGRADFPVYDFIAERRSGRVNHIELPGGVVIAEGIHALNPLLTDVLPCGSVYRIYAGLREEYSLGGQRHLATRDIRLARRLVRDSWQRGHSLEKTLALWPRVCEGETLYVKAFKTYADYLLDTSFSYEPGLLAACLAPLRGALGNSEKGAQLDTLTALFSPFTRLDEKDVPLQSMLREFIGGTIV